MARKKRFSERVGAKSARDVLQVGGIDATLRNRLWNVVSRIGPFLPEHFFFEVWNDILELRLDHVSQYRAGVNDEYAEWRAFKDMFLKAPWHEVYDIVEAVAEHFGMHQQLNDQLEAGGAGYRFVGDSIVPVTAEVEIAEIDTAQQTTDTPTLYNVHAHLKHAVELFGLRPEPDCPNTIKEAICALEGAVQLITKTPGATLGQAVKQLEEAGVMLAPALVGALSKLYGYSSASGGIRHYNKDSTNEAPPTSDDARFVLVTCSAFVNYLLALAREAGIELA